MEKEKSFLILFFSLQICVNLLALWNSRLSGLFLWSVILSPWNPMAIPLGCAFLYINTLLIQLIHLRIYALFSLSIICANLRLPRLPCGIPGLSGLFLRGRFGKSYWGNPCPVEFPTGRDYSSGVRISSFVFHFRAICVCPMKFVLLFYFIGVICGSPCSYPKS